MIFTPWTQVGYKCQLNLDSFLTDAMCGIQTPGLSREEVKIFTHHPSRAAAASCTVRDAQRTSRLEDKPHQSSAPIFDVIVANLTLLLTNIHAVSRGKPLHKVNTNVIVPSQEILALILCLASGQPKLQGMFFHTLKHRINNQTTAINILSNFNAT